MRISRYGNTNSKILDSLLENTNTDESQSKQSFEKIAQNVLDQKSTSLRDIFAQFEGIDEGIEPPGDTPVDMNNDLPEATPPLSDTEPTDQEAKQHIVDALISLCGDVESAKACLDELGGESNLPDDLGPEETLPAPAGSPTEPTSNAPIAGPEEMPAPMLM